MIKIQLNFFNYFLNRLLVSKDRTPNKTLFEDY